MQAYTLSELVKGLDVEIRGDANALIHSIGTLQSASQGQISFLNNPRYKKYLSTTQATAIILHPKNSDQCSTNMIITNNPYFIYAKIAEYFSKKNDMSSGIHPSAIIGKNCLIDPSAIISPYAVLGDRVKIGKQVFIGAGCYIGDDVEIGDECILDSRVTIYFSVKIGSRVRLSSGVVVGSDGFGFAMEKGAWHKVPQLGSVIIEDDVEIGANTCIDRGAIEDTVIGKGVKLDNLIQIGHNVKIGHHTVIAGCTAVAGSTEIGRHCMIGGGVGFSGHITVSDQVVITGMTGVSKSIQQPGVYSSGLLNLKDNMGWRKDNAYFNRLPEVFSRVKLLEKKLNQTHQTADAYDEEQNK